MSGPIDWTKVKLTGKKYVAYVTCEVDTDGVPMIYGERYVEIEPGLYVDPELADMLKAAGMMASELGLGVRLP